MKVLNLQCRHGHAFEGWFGSEDDFRDQLERGLVACPICSVAEVVKLPSAPRLNLSASRSPRGAEPEGAAASADAAPRPAGQEPAAQQAVAAELAALKAAWWRAAREAARSAEDVGERFADEARRIHRGEAAERGIRGQASGEEVRDLMEEGIGVLPLPPALKETLQ